MNNGQVRVGPTCTFTLVAATLCVLGLGAPTRTQTLTVISASAKVCQLTGQSDWYTGQTTNAQTQSRYGLIGVDLGFPVESSNGQLLFLFGDTVPSGHPLNPNPPDDAVGYTTQTSAPTPSTCLGMQMFSPPTGGLSHPAVTPTIPQGSFNVPSGGITVGSSVYAFFWTNHCDVPDAYGPDPSHPLTLPASVSCQENATSNSLGSSTLAWASPSSPTVFASTVPAIGLTYVPPMPNGFAYVTAAEPPLVHHKYTEPHYTKAPLIPVFGVARYRASIPYLAMAPRTTFGAIETWSFYSGLDSKGAPIWLSYAQWQGTSAGAAWSPPSNAELYADGPSPGNPSVDERCVGEHSVTWNAQLDTWLMLYACGGQLVEARTAPQPWGPWSAPTVILSGIQTPSIYCTLLWNPLQTNPIRPGAPCPGPVTSQQIPALTFGWLYAPFVLGRYTHAAAKQGTATARAATIYWLLSTWDPYQVTVMQTTLQLTP